MKKLFVGYFFNKEGRVRAALCPGADIIKHAKRYTALNGNMKWYW